MRVWLVPFLMLAAPAFAQEAQAPLLETTLSENEAIPGQSVTLRLTVLVPSWMPKPPDFPSFEMPNLRVTLPGRATSPTSRTIDGENWSGVTRRYVLTPMVPGRIVLPAQPVGLTYADPGSTEPLRAVVETEPMVITGVLPEGAEMLDPFIGARDLTITQEVIGETTDLAPGDSVTRHVTVQVEGVSPIVLPQILAPAQIPGIRTYPETPQVTETEEDGVFSGSREEGETLMAVSGGAGLVPAIALDWYDLDDGTIRTATVDGFEISVDAPPAPADTWWRGLDWRLVALLVLAVILGGLALRRMSRPLRQRLHDRHAAYLASEAFALKELRGAVSRRDYPAAVSRFRTWQAKATDVSASDLAQMSEALAGVGQGRYGTEGESAVDAATAWRRLDHALRETRPEEHRADETLPPLNPVPIRR